MTKNWTNTSAPLPTAYTPEQEDEFRDVFYTMQDTDVAGWVAQPATAWHSLAG